MYGLSGGDCGIGSSAARPPRPLFSQRATAAPDVLERVLPAGLLGHGGSDAGVVPEPIRRMPKPLVDGASAEVHPLSPSGGPPSPSARAQAAACWAGLEVCAVPVSEGVVVAAVQIRVLREESATPELSATSDRICICMHVLRMAPGRPCWGDCPRAALLGAAGDSCVQCELPCTQPPLSDRLRRDFHRLAGERIMYIQHERPLLHGS